MDGHSSGAGNRLMNFQDYMLAEAQFGGPFELPAAFFDEDENLDLTNGMQYLIDKGLIYNNSIDRPEYGDELKEEHPGAYRFLESYYESQRRALSDMLVEKGYANYFIEDGREVFRWTAKGVEYWKQLQALRDKED